MRKSPKSPRQGANLSLSCPHPAKEKAKSPPHSPKGDKREFIIGEPTTFVKKDVTKELLQEAETQNQAKKSPQPGKSK